MTTLRADVLFLRTPDGGRDGPVATGYRPQFYFEEQEYDCQVTFPEDDCVLPGEGALAVITLSRFGSGIRYGRIAPGCQFAFREGATTVATGIVSAVLESEQATRQAGPA